MTSSSDKMNLIEKHYDQLENSMNRYDRDQFRESIKQYDIDLYEKHNLGSNDITLKSIFSLLISKYNALWSIVELLLHSNNDNAAKILEPGLVQDLIDLSRCHPKNGFVGKFSFGDKNIRDQIQDCKNKSTNTTTLSDLYDMKSKPRGICLLINNFYTTGTYKEMNRFRNIFYQLHFNVDMYKNLEAQQIVDLLIDISKNPELEKHDAFVFMIITHGNEKGEIFGFDGKPLKIDYLQSLLNNMNCEQLRNKPRVLFFNCCRGGNDDEGIKTSGMSQLSNTNTNQNDPISNLIPSTGDFFTCYSTIKGYKAYVDWKEGTKFGESLANAFVEKSSYKCIDGITTKAKRDLVKIMPKIQVQQQFECVCSTLFTKKLFFNPYGLELMRIEFNGGDLSCQ